MERKRPLTLQLRTMMSETKVSRWKMKMTPLIIWPTAYTFAREHTKAPTSTSYNIIRRCAYQHEGKAEVEHHLGLLDLFEARFELFLEVVLFEGGKLSREHGAAFFRHHGAGAILLEALMSTLRK